MRGRTGGIAAAAHGARSGGAACGGGGGSQPGAGDEPGWGHGRRGLGSRLHPAEPADPRQHQRGLRRQLVGRHDGEAGPLQRRYRGARATTSPSPSRPRTTRTSRSSSSRLQVPRRHRGQGQELRRRLELHRVRPERPAGTLLLRARSHGYADVQCPDGDDCKAAAEVQDHERAQGRRRPHLHHQDHRARCRTCRCGWATPRSRRCRTRSSPTRRPTRRSRSGPVRSSWTASHRHRVRGLRSSPTTPASTKPKWTSDLPDLHRPDGGLRRRGADNLDFTDTIPPDQLVGDAYKRTCPTALVSATAGGIPGRHFSPDRRQLKDIRACARPSRWPSTAT